MASIAGVLSSDTVLDTIADPLLMDIIADSPLVKIAMCAFNMSGYFLSNILVPH
jgi:hypothetical protein